MRWPCSACPGSPGAGPTAGRARRRGEHHGGFTEQVLPQQPAHRQWRHPHQPPTPFLVGEPHHVSALGRVGLVVGGEHPYARVVHLLQQGQCGRARGRTLGVTRVLTGLDPSDGAPAGQGRVTHCGERTADGPGQRLPPARLDLGQREGQGVGGLQQPVDVAVVDELGAAPGRGGHGAAEQLGGGHRGDPIDQLVGLVHHHHVVLGQHRHPRDRVDGQQRVVGDHHVDLGRGGTGPLGETIGTHGAAGHPEALPRRHADLPPGLFGDPGHQLVAVTGGRLLRPRLQPLNLTAQLGHRERVEQCGVLRFLGGSSGQAVQAEVVAAALEDGELRRAVQRRRQRSGQAGQVAINQLAL